MSYVNGPTGPTGYQGSQGLQGKQGPLGPPAFGYTGVSFLYNPRMYIITPTSTTINLGTSTTFYNLFNIGPNFTINLPPVTVSYPITELSGLFWSFRNNTGFDAVLTFTGDYSSTTSLANGQTIWLVLSVDANCNSSYLIY
jgi:hypothetical protein